MRTVKLTKESTKDILENLLKRSPNNYGKFESTVAQILDKVKNEGDAALFAYTKEFDKADVTKETIRVTDAEIEEAYAQIDPALLGVIRKALVNIRSYHEKQLKQSWFESQPSGIILGQKVQALSTVGVYIPSGDDEGKTGKDISGKKGAFAEGYNPVLDTSVGNVCKHAQSGDVDVAFVYTSDVYRFGGVEIVGTVPADTHKNIVYPGAITSQSKNVEATQEFLGWCQNSEKAQEIWQKWGFELA